MRYCIHLYCSCSSAKLEIHNEKDKEVIEAITRVWHLQHNTPECYTESTSILRHDTHERVPA